MICPVRRVLKDNDPFLRVCLTQFGAGVEERCAERRRKWGSVYRRFKPTFFLANPENSDSKPHLVLVYFIRLLIGYDVINHFIYLVK